MFVTGPDVIKTVTHEEVTKEELGGAMTHNATSGVAHFAVGTTASVSRSSASSSASCPRTISTTRRGARRTIRSTARTRRSTRSCPRQPNQPYDMHDLMQLVIDDGEFLEVHAHYARNIIVGFARLGGRPVGIVANQPAVLAGVLDIDASVKAARFVRFCDAFNIPLVTFEDVPGFLPGVRAGARRHHSARCEAAVRVCEATVPKITVITRKAYGGAYDVMAEAHPRRYQLACPTAEIAVMGPKGAVNILFRPERRRPTGPRRAELVHRVRRETRESRSRGRRAGTWTNHRSADDARETHHRAGERRRTSATRTRRRNTANPALGEACRRKPCVWFRDAIATAGRGEDNGDVVRRLSE